MTKRSDGGSQNWLIHDIKRIPQFKIKLAPNLNLKTIQIYGNSYQDTRYIV